MRRAQQRRAARAVAASLLALGLPLGFGGCGKKSDQAAPKAGGPGGSLASGVLARVNDSQLSEADLQRLLPDEVREGVTGSEIRDILDRWVRSELLYQKAQRDDLAKDPLVAARIHALERDLLADELLQRELANRVQVRSEDLHAWYRAHQAEYTQEVRLQHIVVNSREDAEEILDMLNSGASFEQIARQRSVDPTGTRGGELGYLGKGGMNPAFESFAFAAAPGTVVGPVATTFGFHVVKVLGRRQSTDPIPFEAARDEIMHTLLLEKQQEAQAKLLQELQSGAQVQIATSYGGLSLTPEPHVPDATAARSFVTRGGGPVPNPVPAAVESLPNSRD